VYITHLTLRYPNGRVHEEMLTTWEYLDVGSVFELYGHRWTVVGTTRPRSRYDHTRTRLVCEVAEAAVAA
jgi:hypothetical protein